jgi:hypothetical protein
MDMDLYAPRSLLIPGAKPLDSLRAAIGFFTGFLGLFVRIAAVAGNTLLCIARTKSDAGMLFSASANWPISSFPVIVSVPPRTTAIMPIINHR